MDEKQSKEKKQLERKWKRGEYYFNILAFTVLLLITIFLTSYSVPIILELYSHPLEKAHTTHIRLTFPDKILGFKKSLNGSIQTDLAASADLYLIYDEPLVEGTNVTIKGGGCLFPLGRNIIGFVSNVPLEIRQNTMTGIFEGSTGVKKDVNPSGYFDIPLDYCNVPGVYEESNLPILENITWDSEGDYSPYLIFPRITGEHDTIYFNDIKIHVGGQDILRQERYSNTNTWLSIIFFVFTIITALTLLCSLGREIGYYALFSKYETNDNEDNTTENSDLRGDVQQPQAKEMSRGWFRRQHKK